MNNSNLQIDAVFDGGNIVCKNAENPSNIRLEIRSDNSADYRQWFYFKASHVAKKACTFSIENAADAAYPEAWLKNAVFASSDRCTWSLLPTQYSQGVLSFSLTPESDVCYFALHTPYSQARHLDLISTSLLHENCSLFASASSVQGRKLEVLQVGRSEADKPAIWIIARQHPAETMAEWFMEGLLKRLLSVDDDFGYSMAELATFYLVPNMNPDGSVLGNFRTNAAGVDLNRAWDLPDSQTSPEVYFIKQCMDVTGVEVFLDIHGDEELHFAFAAGCEGIAGYGTQQSRLDQQFRRAFNRSNSDFCTENGYPADLAGEGDLSIACNQIGSRFKCLSLTIEIPFVDNQYRPDTQSGWSSERSQRLGASVLEPIHEVLAGVSELPFKTMEEESS